MSQGLHLYELVIHPSPLRPPIVLPGAEEAFSVVSGILHPTSAKRVVAWLFLVLVLSPWNVVLLIRWVHNTFRYILD